MPKKGRPHKEFQEYLLEPSGKHVLHEDYIDSPATSFLRYTVDAKDAILNCTKRFSKSIDGSFTKDSLASLQHIVAAFLPAIMGHFEIYQKYLFAGIFENSTLLKGFKADSFFKKLENEGQFVIDPVRLSAYRGFDAPVGILLADNMKGWHSPEKVNKYFKMFNFNTDFFSNDDCKNLKVLWQLRHSIVHTGGTITIPDSQKIEGLRAFGGKAVVLDHNFINGVSRRFHSLIKDATGRLQSEFTNNLLDVIATTEEIDKLFLVKSKTAVWLR